MADGDRSSESPARWQEWTAWLRGYEALGLEQALALAVSEHRRYRVIRPADAVTLDLNSSRLNLWLDDDGNLARMTAG